MSIFGTLVTPDDVRQEQARLLAAAQGTNASVVACTKLDAVTRESWTLFYNSVVDMVTKGPTFWGAGGDMDQTQKREGELYAWQQKLATACTINMPVFNPVGSPNPDTQALVQLTRYAVIGASVVAGAYVVGKFVSLIPPRRPEFEPEERVPANRRLPPRR